MFYVFRQIGLSPSTSLWLLRPNSPCNWTCSSNQWYYTLFAKAIFALVSSSFAELFSRSRWSFSSRLGEETGCKIPFSTRRRWQDIASWRCIQSKKHNSSRDTHALHFKFLAASVVLSVRRHRLPAVERDWRSLEKTADDTGVPVFLLFRLNRRVCTLSLLPSSSRPFPASVCSSRVSFRSELNFNRRACRAWSCRDRKEIDLREKVAQGGKQLAGSKDSEIFSQNWICLGFLCSTFWYSQARSCNSYKCVSSLDGARAA